MNRIVFCLSACIVLLSLTLLPAAAERVVISEPLIDPQTAEAKARVAAILEATAATANSLYGEYFEAAWHEQGGKADYTLKLFASLDPQYATATLTLKRESDGAETEAYVLMGELTNERIRHMANAVFYLWSSFHGYFSDRKEPPPVLVDELSSDIVAQSLLSQPGGFLMPSSVAVKQNGNLLVAFSSLCVEFDRFFRIVSQPGRQLLDQGNYTYAYTVSVTPGDTVILKPSMGRELYRVIEGAPRPQKWRVGMDLTGPFAVLPDGSVFILDQTKRKAYRIAGRKKYELNVFSGPYDYVSAVTVGPEGNIWVYDIQGMQVRIYSPKGEMIDSIIPIVDKNAAITPLSMTVYDDGRFVVYSNGAMYCFRRDGTPVWEINEIVGLEGSEPMPQMAAVAIDSQSGMLYLSDQLGKRILKLYDRAYAGSRNFHNEFEEKLLELNGKLEEDPGDTQPLRDKARLYEELGAYEMAKSHLERALDLDPFDGESQDRLDGVEVSILVKKAADLRVKTIDRLERLGPASAQMLYNQALQQYELILSMDPGREDARKDLDDLNRRFLDKSAAPQARKKPITVVKLRLENLFPSLMQYYRTSPVGTVIVKNTLDEDVTNLEARLLIRKYMDFSAKTERTEPLKPGEQATIDLRVLFNDQIFGLQEDLPVQAQVELVYQVGGLEQSVSKSVTTTIYRRTALTWDDTGKIASFFMPNEGIVSQFSHRVSRTGDVHKNYRISEKFFRAIKISDALGAYNIHYIEDPESPFSKILGKAEIVDTVRFPRTTLMIRSGDCDDTTALLASLLESAGIPTAVMTSPGHVFVAFNSGEPAGNAWMYRNKELEVIPYGGKLWIPVETTILDQGFLAAWKEASRLFQTYSQAGKIEFLPLEKERAKYPAIPLPKSIFTVIEPGPEEIDPIYLSSLEGMEQSLYTEAVKSLTEAMKNETGKKLCKLKNRVGILHALYGRDPQAVALFKECIREFPKSSSAYINLANVYISREELDLAKSTLHEALALRPDSAVLNLVLAQVYYQDREQGLVREYYSKVEKRAPDLAERFSYLVEADSSGAPARASAAQAVQPLLWDLEED